MSARAALAATALLLAALTCCAGGAPEIPLPDLDGLEAQVARRIEEFAAATRRQRHSAAAWGDLGRVLDAHGFLEEAVQCYRQALAIEPDGFPWTYHLAVVLDLAAGDPDEIVQLFLEAGERRPNYPPLWYRLGETESRRGDHGAARRQMEKVVELDPGSAAGHRGLGQQLLALGEAEAARLELERAVSLDLGDGAAWAALAQARRLAGDPDRAREAAARSARTKPRSLPDPLRSEVSELNTSAAAVAARGRLALDAGRYDEAIELFRKSDAWKPGSASVQYGMGVSQLRAGRPEQARGHFLEAVALGDDAEAHWRLGVMLLDEGQSEASLEHLRRAAARAPEDGALFAQIATALARAGRQEEALDLFERALELGPDSAGLRNNWGAALLQLGRDEQALAHFERAAKLDPEHAEARSNAGRALEQLGRR